MPNRKARANNGNGIAILRVLLVVVGLFATFVSTWLWQIDSRADGSALAIARTGVEIKQLQEDKQQLQKDVRRLQGDVQWLREATGRVLDRLDIERPREPGEEG